jgi:pyruvate dehydrogenase E1 component
VIAAAELLQADFGIPANVWSVTSFNELRRDGLECARWNMLHPLDEPRVCYVTQRLAAHAGPCIAATDYIRAYAGQIREYVPQRYRVLGTDGFGRSDSRRKLREYFEVNRHYVVVAALKALAEEGEIAPTEVASAIAKYGIDPEKPNPMNQ